MSPRIAVALARAKAFLVCGLGAPVSAVLILLSGCGGSSEREEVPEPARGQVPNLAHQRFLADRVCKGILDVKHRPSLREAVQHRDAATLRAAIPDLKAAGSALGKFPDPSIRGQTGSGMLKVAQAIEAVLARNAAWEELMPAISEQRAVALDAKLPGCAIP